MIEHIPRLFTTAVSWDTLASGAEASFLYKACKEGHESFYKKQGDKQRLLFRSNGPDHKRLDQSITEVLKERVKSPSRIAQSMADLRLVEEGKYRYLISMDLKDAFHSNNLLMIFIINLFFTPCLVKRIFFPSFLLFQSNSMKAGMSSSLFLLGLCFRNVGSLVPGDYKCALYVDDLRIATRTRWLGWLLIYYYRLIFGVMGFRWHKNKKFSFVDLNTRPKVAIERLGLVIGFRRNGQVYSKVRESTVQKYQTRLKAVLSSKKLSVARKHELTSRILYGKPFGFHAAFPSKVLRGDAQKRRFYAQIARTYRKSIDREASKPLIFHSLRNP